MNDYTEIINGAEYLTVIERGIFEGYHYTNAYAADLIEREGFQGTNWNEKLGFTGSAQLGNGGAVFAWTQEFPEWYSYDPEAVAFHIRGEGYLCEHENEGPTLILIANTIQILDVIRR